MRLREHSDSDLVAALATAGREDCATGAGAHAQAETVLLVTLAVVRLECALHDVLRGVLGEVLGRLEAVKGQTVRNVVWMGQTGAMRSLVGKPLFFHLPNVTACG